MVVFAVMPLALVHVVCVKLTWNVTLAAPVVISTLSVVQATLLVALTTCTAGIILYPWVVHSQLVETSCVFGPTRQEYTQAVACSHQWLDYVD
jgi:hypothetical protein